MQEGLDNRYLGLGMADKIEGTRDRERVLEIHD